MDLNAFRPTDTTAAAIAAALERAQAAMTEAREAAADALARRNTLLLDGTPAQLSAAEKILSAARDMGERVEAIAEQLQTRLAVAKRAELLAHLAAAKVAYEAASARRARWWDDAEPMFRARITDGVGLEAAANNAYQHWNTLQLTAAQQYPEDAGVPDYPKPTESVVEDWFDGLRKALEGTMTTAELQKLRG